MTRHLSGWRRDRPDHRDLTLRASFFRTLTLPRKMDLRGRRLPRVEDQGILGSCTCNAATSAVEDVSIRLNHTVTEMSRLFLYYAVRHWVEHVVGDTGAENRDVMKALNKFGVCPESMWPYDIAKFEVMPPANVAAEAKKHIATQFIRCVTLNSIKLAIARGYSVVGGFTCFSSLQDEATEKTGIVPFPTSKDSTIGGHAVLFVGYNDDSKLLIFENSWGTGWGDKGYGYLPYDYVNYGLADDFWVVRLAKAV